MGNTCAPAADRYTRPAPGWFRPCGRWGLRLPAISLGMWHNFGAHADDAVCRRLCFDALDLGITHFDLANNYGPPPGGAEERLGRILRDMPRHELLLATKAGYVMWPGPYGDGGSRKYLLASLDQSLRRLGLDHVDIFYHHRPDPDTPLDETLGALDQAVRSGRALYAGISNYDGGRTAAAVRTASAAGLTPLLIHQAHYHMLDRTIESGLLPVAAECGLGVIAFCPLAQGLLTARYLGGIPADSRAASATVFLKPEHVTTAAVERARRLSELARRRGQSLAQMALAWVLRDRRVTSALIGASRPEQLRENVAAHGGAGFDAAELAEIDRVLAADLGPPR